MDGRYDEDSGFITFEVNHQSYYVAGYDPVALCRATIDGRL
jgi:hypothetical protein